MRNKSCQWLLGLCLWFALGPSQAASFRALELEQVVAHAQSVVQCRVIDIESSIKTTPAGERIYTRYLLAIEEQWLAQAKTAPALQSLWVQGGQVGDTVQRVVGYPQLELGQRYVLFIENDASSLPLTGGAQGVYRFLQSKSGQSQVQAYAQPGHAMPLTDFKAQVQALEPRP